MSTELPAQIIDDMLSWPEFRMGVKRARVELADGRAFEDVMVAGGRVVGVLGQEEIPFEASEVVRATDFSDAPLPPAT